MDLNDLQMLPGQGAPGRPGRNASKVCYGLKHAPQPVPGQTPSVPGQSGMQWPHKPAPNHKATSPNPKTLFAGERRETNRPLRKQSMDASAKKPTRLFMRTRRARAMGGGFWIVGHSNDRAGIPRQPARCLQNGRGCHTSLKIPTTK